MSRPAPVTENVPLDSLDRPARAGLPMSRFDHVDGAGDVAGALTVTLLKVAIAVADALWLVTARPTWTVAPIEIVSLPTSDHELPLADTYDVKS
jgi:hypothetical protein